MEGWMDGWIDELMNLCQTRMRLKMKAIETWDYEFVGNERSWANLTV